MKGKSFCFCIPRNKKKDTGNEEESQKPSDSPRKNGKRGKSRGDVAKAPGDDHSEPSHHGTGNSANDAGAGVAMMGAVHGHAAAMDGGGCGSSHGGGGGDGA
ncbi:hypothetical protein AB3S75_039153 [Citrus x aurantiifolia]